MQPLDHPWTFQPPEPQTKSISVLYKLFSLQYSVITTQNRLGQKIGYRKVGIALTVLPKKVDVALEWDNG